MILLNRILVPVDFSPRCAWAVRYASNLARKFKATITCVHVGHPGTARKLEDFVGPAAAAVKRSLVMLEGDPAEAILSFAGREAIDLIVMPTHAHGRFRRFLLGSVTAKVLHDASCPVWTGVHHQDAPPSDKADVQSIVCAVECDESSLPLIRWSRDLAEALRAQLRFIHAVPAADETSDNCGEIEVRKYLFARAEAGFFRLCQSAGIGAEISLAGGSIVRVVREAALRDRADVIVIGRGHTQGGPDRLRTHAYAIIRESPCPVVSI